MGAQLPPGLPQASRLPASIQYPAGAAADRHGDTAGDRRYAGQILDCAGRRGDYRLLPAQPQSAGGAGQRLQQAAPVGGMAGRQERPAHHRLRHPAEDRRTDCRAPGAARLPGQRLSRGYGARAARIDPAPLHGGRAELHRRYHRLRHGHRQGGHPQRGALRPAQVGGKLQSGNRSGRARRQCFGLSGAGQPGQPQRAAEFCLWRHTGARGHPLRARRAAADGCS